MKGNDMKGLGAWAHAVFQVLVRSLKASLTGMGLLKQNEGAACHGISNQLPTEHITEVEILQ